MSGLLPTTAFEAAMQATTRPPQHPGQQGPFDRRLQGSYGAVNSSRASDVRRNPVENMSHQLEVVMQSGVQWFREAWRARSGTVVQQDPGVVPPAPVQPPLPADLGMTPEMRIDVNPRTPQQLQQIPTSWNGEGVRKERLCFRHNSWKLWRGRRKDILYCMVLQPRHHPAALPLATFRQR